MLVTSLAVTTALLYMIASGIQLVHIMQHRPQLDRKVFALGLIALSGQAIVAWNGVVIGDSVALGFYRVPALIFLVVNIACFIGLLRRPLQNLILVLFPLSALTVLLSAFGPETAAAEKHLPPGVVIHIVSSILAYSVLTLAAFQAILVAIQDHQLKARHTRGIIEFLPPLQLMETMLFELLWIGVVLLTLSIGSGMIFLDDIFAQQLVHKTVLTIIAWGLFSTLLWGHSQKGWRSQTAVRLTLGGFALLMVGYFGSKLVLELVLQTP
jgi:ABC-type uncharacterized transport system permease subunit